MWGIWMRFFRTVNGPRGFCSVWLGVVHRKPCTSRIFFFYVDHTLAYLSWEIHSSVSFAWLSVLWLWSTCQGICINDVYMYIGIFYHFNNLELPLYSYMVFHFYCTIIYLISSLLIDVFQVLLMWVYWFNKIL
jgi:hypothetical protein